MDSNHPLIKNAVEKVQKYADDVEELLDETEISYMMSVIMFDFEAIEKIKGASIELRDKLDEFLEGQEKRFNNLVKFLNYVDETPDDELVTILWDLKRPVLYKLQRLNALIDTMNTVMA